VGRATAKPTPPAAGNPIENLAAVRAPRVSRDVSRRPRTVPSPQSVAAPKESRTGMTWGPHLAEGSGNATKVSAGQPALLENNEGRCREVQGQPATKKGVGPPQRGADRDEQKPTRSRRRDSPDSPQQTHEGHSGRRRCLLTGILDQLQQARR
jgi:hypothetical protein